MNSTTSAGRPRVAYVVKRFPRLSETFILNEILALESLGLNLDVVSIHRADTKLWHKQVDKIRARVYYLPESIWPVLPGLLRAQAHFLINSPSRWIRSFNVMFWRHNPKAARHWLLAGLVARHLEGRDTRHIHAHFSTSPTSISMMASILLGLRYSLTCHAKDVYADGRLHSPGFFRNLNRASFVVVASKRTKGDILGAWPSLPPEKIHVIYNGLDLRKFQPREKVPRDHVVLSVGRLVEKKGFEYVVRAWGLLPSNSARFEIVGYGSIANRLVQLAITVGIKERLRFVGALPQERLIAHYQDATVFCLGALVAGNDDRDILPNVLKEAMAVGVPVVTTNIPGIEELVKDGSSGLVVPQKDPDSMAEALNQILVDQKLAEDLGIGGRRIIEEHFDMMKNVPILLDLLVKQVNF